MLQLFRCFCRVVAGAAAAAAVSSAGAALVCTCFERLRLPRCSDDAQRLVAVALGRRHGRDGHWRVKRAAAELVAAKFAGVQRDVSWQQLCQCATVLEQCVFTLDLALRTATERKADAWLPTCPPKSGPTFEACAASTSDEVDPTDECGQQELLVERAAWLLRQAPDHVADKLGSLWAGYNTITDRSRPVMRRIDDLQRQIELEEWLRSAVELLADLSRESGSGGWLADGVPHSLPLLRHIYSLFIGPAERAADDDNRRKARKRSASVVGCVLRTLANLCLLADGTAFAQHLLHSGWLEECGRLSSQQAASRLRLELRLHAARALHNVRASILTTLDAGCGHECARYADGVHVLHWPQHAAATSADVVFVHGLIGSVLKTWRQKDAAGGGASALPVGVVVKRVLAKPLDRLRSLLPQKEGEGEGGSGRLALFTELQEDQNACHKTCGGYTRCWPQDWLSADVAIERVRIIAADYETYLSRWREPRWRSGRSQFAHKVWQLDAKLSQAQVGSRPIIWVGHSMGGILIKQLVCADPNLAAHSSGYAFLSTPHFGSHLASTHAQSLWSQLLLRPADDVTHLVHNCAYVRQLNRLFLHIVRHRRPAGSVHVLSIGESLPSGGLLSADGSAGTLGLVVTERSAYPGIGAYYCVRSRHLDTCKPTDRTHPVYVLVCRLIGDVLASQ